MTYTSEIKRILAENPSLTAAEVVARVGCSDTYFYAVAKKHSLKYKVLLPGRDKDQRFDDALRKMANNDWTKTMAAESLGGFIVFR